MNSLSVAPAVAAVKPFAAKPLRAESGFWAGFQAYCNGLSVADLTDPAEIRGWWSALDAESAAAAAMTPFYGEGSW